MVATAVAKNQQCVIRSGRYRLEAPINLPSNAHLTLEPGVILDIQANIAAAIQNADTANGNTNITLLAGTGARILGNKTDRSLGGRNRGVYFSNVTWLKASGFIVDGAEDHGLQLTSCQLFQIEKVHAINNGKAAGSIGGTGIAISTLTDGLGGQITDCSGANNWRCGLKIGHGFSAGNYLYAVFAAINVSGFIATGNGLDGSSPGIELAGNGANNRLRGVSILGAKLYNNLNDGLLVETGIEHCTFHVSCRGNGKHGVRLYHAVVNCTFLGAANSNGTSSPGVYDGVYIHDNGFGCSLNRFIGFVAKDDQPVKTQRYGASENDGSAGNSFTGDYTGNLTGTVLQLSATSRWERTIGELEVTTSGSASTMGVRVVGDTVDRTFLTTDSRVAFSSGAAAADASLYRDVTGTVTRVRTNQQLVAASGITTCTVGDITGLTSAQIDALAVFGGTPGNNTVAQADAGTNRYLLVRRGNKWTQSAAFTTIA
jgi:hypothetical protein